MTIHENTKDREQQKLAMFQLQRHLTALGVTQVVVEETPPHLRECYDGKLYVQGMWVGVVEVKTRDMDTDTLRKRGSIIVETERLRSLSKQFWHRSGVTGKGFWSKEVVFVFRMKFDDTVYAINIRRIRELWKDLEDAPDGMLKDNHGKVQANKHGKLIPFESLERVE